MFGKFHTVSIFAIFHDVASLFYNCKWVGLIIEYNFQGFPFGGDDRGV